MSTTPATIDLHHVHLVTADIRGFCDFFTTHFGAEVVFDDSIDGDRNVFPRVSTGRIHPFESKKAPDHGRNLFHHVGLLIDDLDTLVRRLKAEDVGVTDITALPGGGFAMATGPDGLLIELFEVTSEENRRYFIDGGDSQDSAMLRPHPHSRVTPAEHPHAQSSPIGEDVNGH